MNPLSVAGVPVATSRLVPRGTIYVVNPGLLEWTGFGTAAPRIIAHPFAVWCLRCPTWWDRFADDLERRTRRRMGSPCAR